MTDWLSAHGAAAQLPGWPTLGVMQTACAELSCRARIACARFALERLGLKPASVVWLEEAEANLSARHSALVIVETFTMANIKPRVTRLWSGGR
jgi:hypothetical protein